MGTVITADTRHAEGTPAETDTVAVATLERLAPLTAATRTAEEWELLPVLDSAADITAAVM
jgi:hypothetical protein